MSTWEVAVGFAAVGLLGCAEQASSQTSVGFAVFDPHRCAIGDLVTVGAAKHDRDVEIVRTAAAPSVLVEGAWVSVDGAPWKAPGHVQWAGAVRDRERLAVAVISSAMLFAAVSENGLPVAFEELGPAHASAGEHDATPDLAIQDDSVAIAWDDGRIATHDGTWHTHTLQAGPYERVMHPRVAAIGRSSFVVVWRAGTIERSPKYGRVSSWIRDSPWRA